MYFKCKCGKTFKSKKSKQCHIGRVHTAAYCRYCNERHEDINTHLRWYCKKNPKSRDYVQGMSSSEVLKSVKKENANRMKAINNNGQKALETLLMEKKRALVLKQMDDMMKDKPTKGRDGIRIAIPPFTPKNIPNIVLPLKVFLEVSVEVK